MKNGLETLDETAKDQIRLLNCAVMRFGGNQVLRNGSTGYMVCHSDHGSLQMYVCV